MVRRGQERTDVDVHSPVRSNRNFALSGGAKPDCMKDFHSFSTIDEYFCMSSSSSSDILRMLSRCLYLLEYAKGKGALSAPVLA